MTRSVKGNRKRQVSHSDKQNNPVFIALGFYVVLAILLFKGSIHWVILGWYVLLGLATYALYAKDKKAAILNKWRTPEMTLHLLSLLGGWVGAMVAQNYLRHKTQKSDFRLVYYLTVITNIAFLLFIVAENTYK